MCVYIYIICTHIHMQCVRVCVCVCVHARVCVCVCVCVLARLGSFWPVKTYLNLHTRTYAHAHNERAETKCIQSFLQTY
jgi:hypothetical protein